MALTQADVIKPEYKELMDKTQRPYINLGKGRKRKVPYVVFGFKGYEWNSPGAVGSAKEVPQIAVMRMDGSQAQPVMIDYYCRDKGFEVLEYDFPMNKEEAAGLTEAIPGQVSSSATIGGSALGQYMDLKRACDSYLNAGKLAAQVSAQAKELELLKARLAEAEKSNKGKGAAKDER